MEDFYKLIINDLKNQIAVLSDQKATQVAINTLQQADLVKLQEENTELKQQLEDVSNKKKDRSEKK